MGKKRKKNKIEEDSLKETKIAADTMGESDRTVITKGMKSVLVGIMLLSSIIVYSNTFHSPMVFDDILALVKNPNIRLTDFSCESFVNIFHGRSGMNRPIPMLSFALNYYFDQYNVVGYHVVNIIIHCLCAILLFYFLKQTVEIVLSEELQTSKIRKNTAFWIAFFSSFLWTVHPIQTNSVTYIVQRMNSMSAMFYLAALLLYMKGRIPNTIINKAGPLVWGTGCFACTACAFFCKENAVVLPAFIILYEWFFFQNAKWGWLKKKAIWFSALAVAIYVALAARYGLNPFVRLLSAYDNLDVSLMQRFLTQFRVMIYYITLIFYPNPGRMNLDYDFLISRSLFNPGTTFYSLVAVAGLITLAIAFIKKHRLLAFCILWFFGNLIIESSILPLGVIYEHRLYLPSMMPIFMAIYLLYRFVQQKRVVIVLCCSILILFSFWTFKRNIVWSSDISLFSDCVEKSPNKARVRDALGIALEKEERSKEALYQFEQAIRIDPNDEIAHNNIGTIFAKKGEISSAIEHFSQAVRINPGYALAHSNLGSALADTDINNAILHIQQAIKRDPLYVTAYKNIADIEAKKGDYEKAILYLTEALKVTPSDSSLYFDLGNAFLQSNQLDDAIVNYKKAILIKDNFLKAREGLANAYLKKNLTKEAIEQLTIIMKYDDSAELRFKIGQLYWVLGDFPAAIDFLEKAIELQSDFIAAHELLAKTNEKEGKLDKAIYHYRRASELAPDDAKIHNRLGGALLNAGDNAEEAVKQFARAIELSPNFANAHNNLGVALMGVGRYEEAIRSFQKSLELEPGMNSAIENLEKAKAIFNETRLKKQGDG